jgi:hypothetical protein
MNEHVHLVQLTHQLFSQCVCSEKIFEMDDSAIQRKSQLIKALKTSNIKTHKQSTNVVFISPASKDSQSDVHE